jgi:predicted kinase
MAQFLILRGAPGVGKSTVAELLRERFPKGISIEVDMLRGMVHGNPWGSSLHHGHAVSAAGQLALHYAACGYQPVVIVDCLVGRSLDDLVEQLGQCNCAVYTLVASEAVLRDRIRLREQHGFTDESLAVSLNRAIASAPFPEAEIIETTALSPQAVADHIVAADLDTGHVGKIVPKA